MSSNQANNQHQIHLQILENVTSTICDSRIAASTRQQYNYKTKKFVEWLLLHHPTAVVGGNLELSKLNGNILSQFFASITYKDPVAKTGLRSHSTVQGHYNALRFLYTEQNIPMPKAMLDLSSKYLVGVRKTLMHLQQDNFKELLNAAETLPEQVSENLRKNFVIEGVVPVSIEDVRSIVIASQQEILSQIKSNSVGPMEPSASSEVNNNTDSTFDFWHWGGKLYQPVPQDYLFPSCSVQSLWSYWFFGLQLKKDGVNYKIRPFRQFKRYNFKTAGCQSKLVKARAR